MSRSVQREFTGLARSAETSSVCRSWFPAVFTAVTAVLFAVSPMPIWSQEEPIARATKLAEQGNAAAAVEILKAFLKEHPESAEGWVAQARLFRTSIHDIENALSSVNRALFLAPNNVEALEQRGLLRPTSGEWTQAEADFTQGLSIDPQRKRCWAFAAIADINKSSWNWRSPTTRKRSKGRQRTTPSGTGVVKRMRC